MRFTSLMLIVCIAFSAYSDTFYMRADGIATKENAIGPITDASACMSLATHNAASFSSGDVVEVSDIGGKFRGYLAPPSDNVAYHGDTSNTPIFTASELLSGSWIESSSGTNIYYWNASISQPTYLWVNGEFSAIATGTNDGGGTLDSLWINRWGYGDNDALGFSTIYMRFAGLPSADTVEQSDQSYAFYASTASSGLTIENCIFEQARTDVFRFRIGATNNTVKNCIIREGYQLVDIEEPDGVVFNSCIMKNSWGPVEAIKIAGSTACDITFVTCHIESSLLDGVSITNTAAGGTVDIVNSSIYGARGSAVVIGSSSPTAVGIKNSWIMVCGWNRSSDYVLDNPSSAGGTIDIDRSYCDPNSMGPTRGNRGTTETNMITGVPGITRPRKGGAVIITSDDTPNAPVVYDSLISYANENNVKWSFGINTTAPLQWTEANIEKIQEMIDSGHGAVMHTHTHAQMGQTQYMKIQYTGAGTSCLMTIDTAAKTLTTVCAGATGDNLNIDLTSSSYADASLLATYINGLTPYACEAVIDPITINPTTGQVCIKEETDTDIKTKLDTVYIELPVWYDGEIGINKRTMDTELTGARTDYIIYPGGGQPIKNDTLTEYLRSIGVNAGRIVDPPIYGFGNYIAFETSTYNMSALDNDSVLAIPEATAILNAIAWSGDYMSLYSHVGTSNVPVAKGVQKAAAALVAKGLVRSFSYPQAMDSVLTNGETYDDGYNYVLRDTSTGDYRVDSESDWYNSGDTTAISGIPNVVSLSGELLTDETGALLVDSVSVGAYGEYPSGVSVSSAKSYRTGDTTFYRLDTIAIYGSGFTGIDSGFVGEDTLIAIEPLNDDSLRFVASDSLDTGTVTFVLSDGETTDSVYMYCLGDLIPTITADPENLTDSIGNDTALYVTASYADSYQWQDSVKLTGVVANLDGEVYDSLHFDGLTFEDTTKLYRVIAINSYGADTSGWVSYTALWRVAHVSTVGASFTFLGSVCTLTVTNSDADSIKWQTYNSGIWTDTLKGEATGADTLFRIPSAATENDSTRAIVWNDVVADTSAAIQWDVGYTFPVIDSLHCTNLRDSSSRSKWRPGDTVLVIGMFGGEEIIAADSTLPFQNSTGTTRMTVYDRTHHGNSVTTPDTLYCRTSTDLVSGVFRVRVRAAWGTEFLLSDTPTAHNRGYCKIAGTQ